MEEECVNAGSRNGIKSINNDSENDTVHSQILEDLVNHAKNKSTHSKTNCNQNISSEADHSTKNLNIVKNGVHVIRKSEDATSPIEHIFINNEIGPLNQNSGNILSRPGDCENYLTSIKKRCKKKVGRRDKHMIINCKTKTINGNGCATTSDTDNKLDLDNSSNSIIDSLDKESILKDYLAFLYGDEAVSLSHNEYDTSFLKIEDSSNNSSSSNSETINSIRHKSIKHKYEYRKDGKDGKPFICGICSKAFGQHSNIILHMRSHTGEKPYICDICSKGFSGKSDLNRHKNIHSVVKKYWCTECKRGFNDNSGFRRHKLIYHSAMSQKCTICPKSYLALKDLERHMKTHNKMEKKPNNVVIGKSTQNMTSSSEDIAHEDNTDQPECSTESTKPTILSVPEITSSPMSELCKDSDPNSNDDLCYRTEERPNKCEQCNFSCSKRSNLRKHIAYVHCLERFYKCDICFKGFKSSWALKRHKQVHSEEKIYRCDICDKGFNDTGSFKYHMKSHRGEKSHQCEICSKCFILKSDLKKHMSSHIKRLQQAAEQEVDEDMEVLIQSDDSFLDLGSYV